MKKDKPYDKSVYRSLMLITQFGVNMIVPIAFMCALGIYFDKKLGTWVFTIIFFFVGAIAGGQNVYRMAKRIYDAPDAGHEKQRERQLVEGKKECSVRNENTGKSEKP